MIRSIRDRGTEDVFNGDNTAASRTLPGDVLGGARRKLDMINAARDINDLRVPPGDRLEKLKRDLRDYYSIRINDKYRVIFKWVQGAAEDVEIVDYH